jgi:hypothetical protein
MKDTKTPGDTKKWKIPIETTKPGVSIKDLIKLLGAKRVSPEIDPR